MAVNRVDFGGETLIDLTGDTLELPEQLLAGVTAHGRDGSQITGNIADNGDVSATMDGINVKSVDIPSGYTTGGTVSLDDTIDNATAAIASAIAGKGVTVPDGTMLDGMAALIEAIEAGGGGGGGSNLDWRGFPILTGTFTPSSDISSDYTIEFPEGERLHYKNCAGSTAKWKPMFLLFPDTQFVESSVQGYIQNIGTFPNTADSTSSPNNTGTIFAYIDGSSVNTTYVKGVYGVSIRQSGFDNSNDYQEVTILSVKIPCTSSLKLKSGLTYRWMMFASIYAEEVTIV